ncbi:MAG: hypothetical protein HY898_23595 [Deltaproteobacteria bacterium]|nr:hypothetical protein [Deltaproteobacteria bacterium]
MGKPNDPTISESLIASTPRWLTEPAPAPMPDSGFDPLLPAVDAGEEDDTAVDVIPAAVLEPCRVTLDLADDDDSSDPAW